MVNAICLSSAIRKCQNNLFVNKKQSYLTRISTKFYSSSENSSSESKVVSIGSVSKQLSVPQNPEFVPKNYLPENVPKETLQDLKWMLQKDLLGQDIFLLGRPGPGRRTLAQQYLELTNREMEYVSLSRDTTESDLKQRREIVGGTAFYCDQVGRGIMNGFIKIFDTRKIFRARWRRPHRAGCWCWTVSRRLSGTCCPCSTTCWRTGRCTSRTAGC